MIIYEPIGAGSTLQPMLDAQTGHAMNNLSIQEMVQLNPQPTIQGSYIIFNDTGTVSYCEQPDIERLTSNPIWHNLVCPFGAQGELINEDGIWLKMVSGFGEIKSHAGISVKSVPGVER